MESLNCKQGEWPVSVMQIYYWSGLNFQVLCSYVYVFKKIISKVESFIFKANHHANVNLKNKQD